MASSSKVPIQSSDFDPSNVQEETQKIASHSGTTSDEWQSVQHRKKALVTPETQNDEKRPQKKLDLPAHIKKIRANSTSFYFSNFPPSWQKKEMWNVFSSHGHVSDIFVPRKVSPLGSCFGFVRFYKSSVEAHTLDKLNCIWVGSFQLKVTLARTSLEKSTPGSNLSDLGASDHSSPEAPKSINFQPDPEATKWLQNCLIGLPGPMLDLSSLNSILSKAGYANSSAVRLEGGEVLLILGSLKDSSRLICDQGTLDLLCLYSVRPWRLVNGKLARSVWVQVRGTPLHCWYERFFQDIAEQFGSLLMVDEKTLNHTEMQYARLQLLTTSNTMIHEALEINTDVGKFQVQVTEEFIEPRAKFSLVTGNPWRKTDLSRNLPMSEWPVLSKTQQAKWIPIVKSNTNPVNTSPATGNDPTDEIAENKPANKSVDGEPLLVQVSDKESTTTLESERCLIPAYVGIVEQGALYDTQQLKPCGSVKVVAVARQTFKVSMREHVDQIIQNIDMLKEIFKISEEPTKTPGKNGKKLENEVSLNMRVEENTPLQPAGMSTSPQRDSTPTRLSGGKSKKKGKGNFSLSLKSSGKNTERAECGKENRYEGAGFDTQAMGFTSEELGRIQDLAPAFQEEAWLGQGYETFEPSEDEETLQSWLNQAREKERESGPQNNKREEEWRAGSAREENTFSRRSMKLYGSDIDLEFKRKTGKGKNSVRTSLRPSKFDDYYMG